MFQYQQKPEHNPGSFKNKDNSVKKSVFEKNADNSLQFKSTKDLNSSDFYSNGDQQKDNQSIVDTTPPQTLQRVNNNKQPSQLKDNSPTANRLVTSDNVIIPSSRQQKALQLKKQEEDIRQNKPKGMTRDTYLKLSNPQESTKMEAQAKFANYKKGQTKQLKRDKQATRQFNRNVSNFESDLIQRKIAYGSEEYNNMVSERFPNYATVPQTSESSAIQKKELENNSNSANLANIQNTSKNTTKNNTGLPDNLKAGMENLSGMSLDDVKVHRNSDKPADLQAHAYAQGTDIHVASGQEQHLPHEAWHVVQQAQGRVQPTMQMKGGVNVNDDIGLEKEADEMGVKATSNTEGGIATIQRKDEDDVGVGEKIEQKKMPGSVGGVNSSVHKKSEIKQGVGAKDNRNKTLSLKRVIQRAKIIKLRIGIIGPDETNKILANQLPENTFVWILSNKAVGTSSEDAKKLKVKTGKGKSSPAEIINENADNIKIPKWHDTYKTMGIYQSGDFVIPRTKKTKGTVDYSFLRFAALESYKKWHTEVGAQLGWPTLNGPTTLVETIDSDMGGVTGETNDIETDKDTGEIKTDWLAEAGVYIWDWTEVKDVKKVVDKFKNKEDNGIDIKTRDENLKEFSEEYFNAEVEAREEVKGDMFNIYFPEPATRISPSALALLDKSKYKDLSITIGNQLGYGRESIGLIAGLVYLDYKDTNKIKSSKKKLKFNASYKVKTSLGKRKEKYASVFLGWLRDKDFDKNSKAKEFDQSYLNEKTCENVNKWHNKTFDEMKNEGEKDKGKSFFHPKS